MKKHVFRWVAALAVLLPCLLISALASPEYSQAGMCGDDLYWEYTPNYIYGPEGYPIGDGTGSLRIYGSGDMYDYSSLGETPWYMEITGAGTEVPPEDGSDPTVDRDRLKHILTGISIENGVTSIGNHAFEGLLLADLPKSVTRIGDYAFYKCSGTTITIPNSVTTVGASAFHGCTDLTDVTIPDSVTTIGSSAFDGCTNLTNVTLGKNVSSIEYGTFFDCTSLTNVTIPDSVRTIGMSAFNGCTSLNSVTMGYGVTSIANYAFFKCSNLTNVSFGYNVNNIGMYAFSGCSNLTSLSLPFRITEIGYNTFSDCSKLTSVTIPNRVTTISDYAFYGCEMLPSVTIPDSVRYIGTSVFSNCTSLTSITVDAYNSAYSGMDGVLYSKDQSTLICYPAGKTEVSYTIPDSVTTIGDDAFYRCANLTSITIPDGVTAVKSHAFGGCTGLTSVTLPVSATAIGEYAFVGCVGLTNVTIPDNVVSIGRYAFSGCTGLTNMIVGNSMNTIENYAFDNCTGLTRIEFLGNTPANVEYGVFNGCDNLTIYYHEGTTGWPTTGTWQGRPLVMIPAEDGGEQEDTYFEVDEYKAAGTAPTQTDKVFAGWYTDETYGQAHTEATGTAYAKFVNKDVCKVKAQVTAGTTAQSKLADIRFVTTVDSLNYKKVGFKITFGGETVTQETTTVYSSIVSSTDGVEVDYTPSDEFHADSKYFVTMVLKDVPNEHFDDTFTVTPYWVTQDGTVVDGVTNELRVSMGY